MASEPRKIVVILGNGFDLDLGLKTSYKDFWESDYCPKDYPAPLIKHLNERWGKDLDKVRWYDLENELLNYALKEEKQDVITLEEKDYLNSIKKYPQYYLTIDTRYCDDQKKADVINSLSDKGYFIQCNNILRTIKIPYENDLYQSVFWRDKKALALIKSKLSEYLRNNVGRSTDYDSSVAYQLLHNLAYARLKGWTVDIYTFNYTDLNQLTDDLLENIPIHYMHGSTQNDNIIIGTKDDTALDKDYDFLQKAMDSSFNPSPLVKDLRDAQEVIIFGHSLGENDRQYFAPFFKKQSDELSNQSKKITLFTYNQQSEMETKRALQMMTDGHLSLLYSLNDLCIIKTKNIKEESKDYYDFRVFLTNHEISEEQAEKLIKKLKTKEYLSNGEIAKDERAGAWS